MNAEEISEGRARAVVLALIQAINSEEFERGRSYADDNMTFEGPMARRSGADAYFKDMEQMKLKYDIRKVFAEGDDVCLFYDLEMDGKTIFGTGWYRVEGGKVTSLRVVFDPRPFLG
ncbi:nuclear transport factor 2 family protein [Pedobacter yulinensis]|uniref:Nuclear transport factor 2 family protein n=1 Tax=Pedobacter yulinensis TaxID=2126353 RepID=A0A2T3HMC1_9SPHI|nr:nuclear transport factor 2 family protein [Pedobacter yulinensis]PST83579.1 nuclear transport factor 2 family protein [Pedobacter yulinensis]